MPTITAQNLLDLTAAAAKDHSLGHPLGSPIRLERASQYGPALDAALRYGEISTPKRVRHFIAQIAHETGSFGGLVESTNYSKPDVLLRTFKRVGSLDKAHALIAAGPEAIANFVYAGRIGNGDEASGDGYRFRGRGFLMVTGRANYAKVESYSHLPVVAQPDLLGQPATAAEASTRFWAWRHINALADANDCAGVTRIVNGAGMLGLDRRKAWLKLGEAIWPGA